MQIGLGGLRWYKVDMSPLSVFCWGGLCMNGVWEHVMCVYVCHCCIYVEGIVHGRFVGVKILDSNAAATVI